MIRNQDVRPTSCLQALTSYRVLKTDHISSHPALSRVLTFYCRVSSDVSLGITNENILSRRAEIESLWKEVAAATQLVCKPVYFSCILTVNRLRWFSHRGLSLLSYALLIMAARYAIHNSRLLHRSKNMGPQLIITRAVWWSIEHDDSHMSFAIIVQLNIISVRSISSNNMSTMPIYLSERSANLRDHRFFIILSSDQSFLPRELHQTDPQINIHTLLPSQMQRWMMVDSATRPQRVTL